MESVPTFSATVWFGSLTAAENNALEKRLETASKITSISCVTFFNLYTSASPKGSEYCEGHSLTQLPFEEMPSGRR